MKYIISDLWEPYRQVVKKLFPNAVMVADKFHYQRIVNVAMNTVRKRVCSTLKEQQSKFVKKHWKLLNKTYNNVDDKTRKYSPYLKRYVTDFEVLSEILSLDEQLTIAHNLYQEFLCLISLEDQWQQQQLLIRWLNQAEQQNLHEFKSVIKTITKWQQPICASFLTYNGCKLNNAFIEGTNNKIKVIKRVSFGYRSFINFRKRILLVFS